MLEGPAGTGKSRAIFEKIWILCTSRPNIRVLVLRKTRTSLTDTGMVTWEDKVCPPGSPIVGDGSRAHKHGYTFPNGSEIVLGGLDKVSKIMSGEYDLIYVQEATEIAESEWETLMTRLRNNKLHYQQIIGDCNPDAPTHWINNREGLTRIKSRHEDNPTLYNLKSGTWTQNGAEYIETLERLSGHRRDRLRYGLWVAPEGARFPNLDSKVHQFDMSETFPHGLPSTYRVILGLDYGLRAPYCALWTAIDHDANLWVFREDYQAGITADIQAQRFVSMTGMNEKIYTVYADPACWAQFPGHTGPSQKCTADFYEDAISKDSRFGGLVPGFNKSRRLAFDTIDALLNRGNDYPNIYFERKACPNIWRELTEAIWDAKGTKEDIDPSCDDHAITAGYYGWHTFIQGSPELVKPLPSVEEIRTNDARLRAREAERSFYRRNRIRV